MKDALEGYKKFRSEIFPQMKDHYRLLAEMQAPHTLFITCADSRIVPNLMLQAEPGELFICRNVGNVVPPVGELVGGTASTIEYAVEVLKVKHLVICGHSDCGAIRAVLEQRDLSRLPITAQWLRYIETAWQPRKAGVSTDDFKARHTAMIRANIIAQVENLKTHPEVASGLAQGTLQVHGWYYDIVAGAIEEYDGRAGKFVPLDELHAQ